MFHYFSSLELIQFLDEEALKKDGSNFSNWYHRLRALLVKNEMLHVMHYPLGDKPGIDASEDEDDDYRSRSDDHISVQVVMLQSMDDELRVHFEKTNAYDMLAQLRTLFAGQVNLMRYRYIDLFLSIKMEDGEDILVHIARLYDCLLRLVELDYDFTDDFAVNVVLRSLPSKYKKFVRIYLMQKDSLYFTEMLWVLNNVIPIPEDGEGTGEYIYDICLNVFFAMYL